MCPQTPSRLHISPTARTLLLKYTGVTLTAVAAAFMCAGRLYYWYTAGFRAGVDAGGEHLITAAGTSVTIDTV